MADPSRGGFLRVFLAAGVGYHKANIFVSDLFGYGFFDGLQQIQTEAAAASWMFAGGWGGPSPGGRAFRPFR